MKKLSKIILIFIFSLSFVSSYAQQESAQKLANQEKTIFKFVDNYIDSIPHSTNSLIVAVDYAINFAKDSTTKSQIAGYLFNKFSTSTIMGDETIAVYIAKNYFLNGLLPWFGQGGMALLRLYTEFNENSLIGMKAPELNLNTADGQVLPLTSLKTRYTVIYFFDKDCNVCKESLPTLKEIIKTYHHLSLEVYAVYTQSDSSSLNQFLTNNFDKQELTNWHFVYDPTMESNFYKLYNVLVTPRLFLLNRDKIIIGRNLSNDALKKLLSNEQKAISDSYTVAKTFVEQYISLFDLKDTSQNKEAFEPLFNRLSTENLDMYNAAFYQLFEYLATQEEQYMKTAAVFLAEKYILPYKQIWFNDWFLYTRIPETITKIKNNTVGSTIPSPTLYTSKGKQVTLEQKKSKYIYLYFFNPSCAICKPFSEEVKKIYRDLKKKRVKVIAIYTGTDIEELNKYIQSEKKPWQILFQGTNPQTPLYNYFEISYLPQTYLINRDGIIIAKGINTIQLLKLIK